MDEACLDHRMRVWDVGDRLDQLREQVQPSATVTDNSSPSFE